MKTFKAAFKQLVKQGSTAIAAVGFCICAPAIAFAQQVTEIDPQYSNYYGTLTVDGKTYYKYGVPANTFGVFTLKNSGGGSDFDIYVYEYTDDYQLIGRGENSGTQTELIVTPPSIESRYVYITVVNEGRETSEYKLYADYVSPVNKFMLSAAKAVMMHGFDPDMVSSRAASRTITGIFSLAEGNGLTGVTKDLVINEMTEEMRAQFGYGAMGDFMLDWTLSMVSGFYKNYP
ncbi:MAG: hypothetical protein AAFQ14_10790 [Cyanobacteria bacterium J06621_12]